MAMIGGILAMLGILVAIVGGIWLLVVIFKEGGILWLLGSIFIPFVSLIFVIMNWQPCKKPFLIQVVGVVVMFVGSFLSGAAS